MSTREGNAYLEFPEGADGRFPEDRIEKREIVLGENTINTCNIAMADVDGDGLEEIATPITIGEDDCARVYRGDGRLVWENPEVRLYHAYYGDSSRPPAGMAHMWYREPHRHVLTEIVDFDGDGKLEVVVGDGPIYVLDAATGSMKSILDLGGLVAMWNVVHDPQRGLNLLIGTADHRDKGPRVVAVDPEGSEVWAVATPGKVFCDCLHHGDLDLDGRPEIAFSIEDAKAFWCLDCDGRIRFKKDVPKDLGDDPHVDDFLIDRILPEDRADGAQLLLVTGPNLLDREGRVLWTRRDSFDHAQKVLVADFRPDRPGKEVYFVESYARRAHLLDCDGEDLWTYDNFTRSREGYEHARYGRAIGRLTTAGDLIDWNGDGTPAIVQSEMGGPSARANPQRKKPIPPQALVRFMHVLDANGRPLDIFPIGGNPMCARAANVTASRGQDIVMVGHETSRIEIYSKKI